MPIRALLAIGFTIPIFVFGPLLAFASSHLMDSHAIKLSQNDQQLTARIDNVPLRQVLQVLANQLSITITLLGQGGHTPFSTTFTDLSLEQGIEQILRGQDYALLYSQATSSQQPSIKEIIVLPRQSSLTTTAWAETEIVMSPMENQQEFSENQKQPPFNTFELRKLEPTELAHAAEALHQLSDQSQTQRASQNTQAMEEENFEIREIATTLLEQLESPSQ